MKKQMKLENNEHPDMVQPRHFQSLSCCYYNSNVMNVSYTCKIETQINDKLDLQCSDVSDYDSKIESSKVLIEHY